MRTRHWLTFGLLTAMLAVATPASSFAKDRCEGFGNRNAIASAQRLYWEWALGAAANQRVGRLFFVPIPGRCRGLR